MPQLRIENESGCFHTISVTRSRAPIFNDPAKAAILVECIRFASQTQRAFVLAFAVMPDHLHLLLAPREGNSLAGVMHGIKRFAVKRINEETQRAGPLWQQGYYDRAIRTEEHLRATIEYIQRNPVENGLSIKVEDYRFSSAHPEAWNDLDAFLTE